MADVQPSLDTLRPVSRTAACTMPQSHRTLHACRVCRRRLRAHLLRECSRAGVKFLAAEVTAIDAEQGAGSVRMTLDTGATLSSRCGQCRGAAPMHHVGRSVLLEPNSPASPPMVHLLQHDSASGRACLTQALPPSLQEVWVKGLPARISKPGRCLCGKSDASDSQAVQCCRLVTLAAGAAAGKFLQFQEGPGMGVQTAYGLEADVSGYVEAYDERSMLFMDFRRHHSGVWPSTASRHALCAGTAASHVPLRLGACKLVPRGAATLWRDWEDLASRSRLHDASRLQGRVGASGITQAAAILRYTAQEKRLLCRLARTEHPAAGEGLWGTDTEAPSFLYAMPLGGGRVFLEETCLVAKPAVPFAALKRRLHRRLRAMGIQVQA